MQFTGDHLLLDRKQLRSAKEFCMSRRRSAFTLVELLVVIGIIALLISMLLPALQKARQQANLIDCQSRLRQMGQALDIYVVDNKGSLPYGLVSHPDAKVTWTASTADAEPYWWWMFTLGQILNKNMVGSDGMVHNLSPIFTDKDTINAGTNINVFNYVNHYACNERVLWSTHDNDFLPSAPHPLPNNNSIPQRKMGSVRPSSSIFVIFDAPQCMDQGGNSYPIDTELDGNSLTFDYYFCLGVSGYNFYGRPVMPGGTAQSTSVTICKAAQKKFNRDLASAFNSPDGWENEIRFRHENNTKMNALCLDGHVEVRTVGTAMVTDFCTNIPY
jgi:prepilin-type N-terminal cleavage/methylation domain-containing protein